MLNEDEQLQRKIIDTERIVEGSENHLEKQVLNKVENYKETISTSEEKPNEKVVRKIEERQGTTY